MIKNKKNYFCSNDCERQYYMLKIKHKWRVTYRDPFKKTDYANTEKQILSIAKSLEKKGHRIIKLEKKVGDNWELI